jgi:hypothetical protein
VVAQPCRAQRLDDAALNSHRRRQQRGEPDDLRARFAGFLDELFRGNVDAEVVHLEAVRRQHRRHERLADLVNVPLHGADHDPASGLECLLTGAELRLQQGHRTLHSGGGDDQVRQEVLAVRELLTHDLHAGQETFVEDGHRLEARSEALFSRLNGEVGVPVHDARRHLFQQLSRHLGS